MGLNLLLGRKTAMEILIPLMLMLSTIINLFCGESGIHVGRVAGGYRHFGGHFVAYAGSLKSGR